MITYYKVVRPIPAKKRWFGLLPPEPAHWRVENWFGIIDRRLPFLLKPPSGCLVVEC